MRASTQGHEWAAVFAIVMAITGCGGARVDPLDEVAERLVGPSLEERRAAAAQIAAMDHVPLRWSPLLTAALDDSDLQVRLDAAMALGHTGTEGVALLAELAKQARQHPCSRTRHALTTATEQIAARARTLDSP